MIQKLTILEHMNALMILAVASPPSSTLPSTTLPVENPRRPIVVRRGIAQGGPQQLLVEIGEAT
jgi:hypothetical protein